MSLVVCAIRYALVQMREDCPMTMAENEMYLYELNSWRENE